MRSGSHTSTVPCVGAVIRDGAGRLLLVRRTHAPGAGRWSLPGGRVEPGETGEQALAREVAEETGLIVAVGRHVGSVDREAPDGVVYAISDHECEVRGGSLRPGDDAGEVAWYDAEEMAQLPLTELLLEQLQEWGVLQPR